MTGWRKQLAALACMVLATACGHAWAHNCKIGRAAEWKLRPNVRQFVVDGTLNGEKVGVLLDTGSSENLVLRSAAIRLGLTRQEARGYRFFGIGGESSAESVYIDEFKVGDLDRKNWRALVAGERDFGGDIAVILGEAFFHQFEVEFDAAHDTVRLYQTKDCKGVGLAYWATQGAGEVKFESMMEGEQSSIIVPVTIDGQPMRAELDSGAWGSVIDKPYAASLGVTPDSAGVVADGCHIGFGSKSVEGWMAPFKTFTVGDETITRPTLRFAELWKHTRQTEVGTRMPSYVRDLPPMLLGADFLRAHRVLIAHSQGKMYFTYAGGTVFPALRVGCAKDEPPR